MPLVTFPVQAFQFRGRVSGEMLPQRITRESRPALPEFFPHAVDVLHERLIERHLDCFHGDFDMWRILWILFHSPAAFNNPPHGAILAVDPARPIDFTGDMPCVVRGMKRVGWAVDRITCIG